MSQSNIKSPLLVWFPEFSLDNKRNIYAKFKTRWQIEAKESALAVFDYWSITDKNGKVFKAEVNEVIAPKKYPSFSLVAENALSVLTYEELTVTLHFLIIVGQNKGCSVILKYFSDNQFRTFRKIFAETALITEEENNIFLKVINQKLSSNISNIKEEGQNEKQGYTPKLDEYIKSVYKEMYYLKQEGGREYKVTNGHFIKQKLFSYLYSFDLEAELFLADDSPISFKMGLRKILGTVSFCENFLIIIELDEPIEDDPKAVIQSGYISSEPWKLLESLNKRLYLINEQNEIALKLINDGSTLAYTGSLAEIQKGQDSAINHALKEPITVIWGPPGTGKTYTMAKLAGEYVRQGKSILIVSHSNISVDNVVKQIYFQFYNSDIKDVIKNNNVLRYGYVRDEELQKNPYVVSFNVAIQGTSEKERYDELAESKARLLHEQEVSHNPKIIAQINEIENKLKSIRALFKCEEHELIKSASVVATTVSKIYADSLFKTMTFDVVMFDEVSMAYVPQIICAASFAKEHLICVGDFRQLAPIVQSGAKKLLGKDLFEHLGICSGFSDIHPHPWLFMLDEQRRMHPDISRFPSKYVYHGLLKNHESVQSKWDKNVSSNPFKNESMTLIDLYSTCCASSKNDDNSRFNILSAVVSFGTALISESAQYNHEEYSLEERVGIITPYAAQTRLIRAMIQDYRKANNTSISCATVHQFQGSERNTVIFDAVESYPSTRAGWLMSKNEGGAVTRLINVALTRSRGKFITVTNKTFWKNNFEPNNMYCALVNHMYENNNVVGFSDKAFSEYFKTLNCGSNIRLFSDVAQCINQVLQEIKKARKEILLLLPQGKFQSEYGKPILEAMNQKLLDGINVAVCRDKNAKIPEEYEKLWLLSEKVTMPLLFVDNAVWYGLPVLQYSFTDKNITYHSITTTVIRFSGVHTVEMIRSLVDRTGTRKAATGSFALYIKNNSACVCGNPHQLCRGKSGYYLKCPKCGKTAFLTDYLINSYLDTNGHGRCPSCGKDMYARLGKYGWYVTCANGHITNLGNI